MGFVAAFRYLRPQRATAAIHRLTLTVSCRWRASQYAWRTVLLRDHVIGRVHTSTPAGASTQAS
jgi:hypothetical protein